ncbi:MAG: hypothetical protein ACH350_10430 [Parachlamydiaceae bacterium]
MSHSLQREDPFLNLPVVVSEVFCAKIGTDPLNIEVIRIRYKLRGVITIKEFWRRVVMLGGFLAQKSDGNLGWQKLWKGWIRLQDMRDGMEMALQKST